MSLKNYLSALCLASTMALSPLEINAQQKNTENSYKIGVGHSFMGWGKTNKTVEVFLQKNNFSLHYFQNYEDKIQHLGGTIYRVNLKTSNSFALAYRPINTKFFSLGGIISEYNFPMNSGTKFNFLLEANLPLTKRIDFSLRHISNGFGIVNKANLGYDSAVISFKLNKKE